MSKCEDQQSLDDAWLFGYTDARNGNNETEEFFDTPELAAEYQKGQQMAERFKRATEGMRGYGVD